MTWYPLIYKMVVGRCWCECFFHSLGLERYQSITQRFYSDASAVMIVYDITDAESYHEATKNWFVEASTYVNPNSNIPVLLVGNKIDLDSERAISFKNAKDFCDKHNLLTPVECSAKTDRGKVAKAFEEIGRQILVRNLTPKKNPSIHVTRTTNACCQLL